MSSPSDFTLQAGATLSNQTIELPLDLPMNEVAKRYLLAVYERHNSHVLRTAVSLHLTQTTVYKWIKRGVPAECRLRGGVEPKDEKPKETAAA